MHGNLRAPILIHRAVAEHPANEPAVVATGSSVIAQLGRIQRLGQLLAKLGTPTVIYNLGVRGTHVVDAALVSHVTADMDPWLVIYGAAFRDFMPHGPSPVQTELIDSTFGLETVAPASVDEAIERTVRAHWLLYRHRKAVRDLLWYALRQIIASFPSAAQADDLSGRFSKTFRKSPSWAAWKRWHESRDFDDYEAYLEKTGKVLKLYRDRRSLDFDLEASPEVEALRHLLRTNEERGTRTIIAYFPENPVFRDPKATAYFNPALSDQVASLLEREAAEFGARFVDLRHALQPDDFVDMVHVNYRGKTKLEHILARLIAQEWGQAQRQEVMTGAIPP